jgi:hypothetical protein
MPSGEGGGPAKTNVKHHQSPEPPQVAAPAALFNHTLPLTTDVVLLSFGSMYQFLERTDLDGTPTWNTYTYDDNAWPSGPGMLGTETNAGTLTALGYFGAANLPTIIPSSRTNTIYIRGKFDWPWGTDGVTFTLLYAFDDGAVLYLNGNELLRYWMTNTPVSYTNFSDAAGPIEASVLTTNLTTAISALTSAQNVLACSLHPLNTLSSDAVYGTELVATVTSFGAPRPRLSIVNHLDGTVTISWSGGGTLVRSSNASAPFDTWTTVPGASSPYTFSPGTTAGQFFYGLKP